MLLTEKGMRRPDFYELLDRQTERARKLLGDDVDTSEQSVLGKYIRINVYDLAECYELLEDIYYARFPGSARGQSLDRLGAFAGVVRNPATGAKYRVKFHGDSGTEIPAGFLISANGVAFYVLRACVIVDGETPEAEVVCTEEGSAGNFTGAVEWGIVNPRAGVASVEHRDVLEAGKEREDDDSFRARFLQSISGAGSATIDALRGAISRVPLVEGVSIVENDTDTTAGGLPPRSFECFVLAPESQDRLVAEAIFAKKPLGIKAAGEVAVTVYDKGDKPHVVRFSRTVRKEVSVRAVIQTDRFFETDGLSQIRRNLMGHINRMGNGETVYVSGLYGLIHDVPGVVTVRALELSEDGAVFSAGDIPVGDYEIAKTSEAAIVIEVVS